MKITQTSPTLGQLWLEDDDDVIHIYQIDKAEYNTYRDGNGFWLTLRVRAAIKLEPADDMNPEPWLEINVPFRESAEPVFVPNLTIRALPYDEKLGNLTNIYYWSHASLEEAHIQVEVASESGFTAFIRADPDAGPVALRATFQRNVDLRRSFS